MPRKQGTQKEIASFFLRSSHEKKLFMLVRSSTGAKLLQAIALVGGLLSSVLGVGTILYSHYQKYRMSVDLVNQVFGFHSPAQQAAFQRLKQNESLRANGIELNSKIVDEIMDFSYYKYFCFEIITTVMGIFNICISNPKNRIFLDHT